VPLPGLAADSIPESRRYRLKNKLLGPPLTTEQLSSERLGRPSALGVLAPDCISSSAYGTEEMLTQMIPFVGLAAYTLVVPITMAILGVLFFVTLSYLDVIGFYTKAGGSYVVARDNFGPKIAQIAAVALLIDYTVTVAVQTAAGTAALTSAFPSLANQFDTIAITIGVICVLLYGNLRGIREAGRFFAVPTYFFVLSLGAVVVVGYIRAALGQLHHVAVQPHDPIYGGHFGVSGHGLLMGLGFIYLLRAFANGGSSLTGLEAISNGVSTFQSPESKHARQTLVIMSSVLAFLVLGTTLLARLTHPIPYASGSPTVVAQEAQAVFGHGAIYFMVVFATMLILYTGGNTSFNGFPFLASFVATDRFLPRQLTRRGHRLAFSNGILVLTAVAITLVLVFRANVTGLVSLYAIGVFTGFTMAGAGMVKHHLTQKAGRWRRGVVVNGFSSVLALIVVLIFAVAKFKEGAWVVVVIGPILYLGLIRLHAQYEREAEALETGALQASEAPILRRHVAVVMVDRLDMATARAIQYARTLTPDDLRAVHFDIDSSEARALEEEWGRLGLARLPLDIIECPDRRLARAAVELVADATLDGETECTVLLPRRSYARVWERFLHDRTADKVAAVLGQVPHVSATIIPYNLPGRYGERIRSYGQSVQRARLHTTTSSETANGAVLLDGAPPIDVEGRTGVDGGGRRDAARRASSVSEADQALARRAGPSTPIGAAQPRHRIRVAGRVKSVRVQPKAGASNLECVLSDGTGGLLLVFQGRPKIAGIEPGARLVAEGMVGEWGRRPAILNPSFELVAGAPREPEGH
jgi:amino acid transporter